MTSATSLKIPFYGSACSEEPNRKHLDAVGFVSFFPEDHNPRLDLQTLLLTIEDL